MRNFLERYFEEHLRTTASVSKESIRLTGWVFVMLGSIFKFDSKIKRIEANYVYSPKTITWGKVFKNGPSKICERQPFKNLKGYGLLKQTISSSFLQAVFHKFYQVHSWILCPKWSFQDVIFMKVLVMEFISGMQLYWKWTPARMFSQTFSEIFGTIFYRG